MKRVDVLPADAMGVSGTSIGVRLWLELRGRHHRTEVSVILDGHQVEELRTLLETADQVSQSLAVEHQQVGRA